MAYEYESQVKESADRLFKVLDLAVDSTPNNQQLLQFLTEIVGVIQSVSGPLSMEQKAIFKAKFGGKLGVELANRGLDKIEDEPNA